jgi:hypothetical protein
MTLRLQSLYEHKMTEIRERQRAEHDNDLEEDSRPSRRRHHNQYASREIEVTAPTRGSRLRGQPQQQQHTTASTSSTSLSRFHNLNNSDLYSAEMTQQDTSLNTSGYSTRRSRQLLAVTSSNSRTVLETGSSSSYFNNTQQTSLSDSIQPGTSVSKHTTTNDNTQSTTVDLDKSFISNNSIGDESKAKNDIKGGDDDDEDTETEVINKSKHSHHHGIKEEPSKLTNSNQPGSSSGTHSTATHSMSKRFRVSRADSGTALSSFHDAYENNSNDFKVNS